MKHYIPLFFVLPLLFASSDLCAYTSGGGTAADPYEIANLTDLLQLADTPGDYTRHFILTDDIDMTPAGPFRKAVIAPDMSTDDYFQGAAFDGVFDGNGHIIRNLVIDPNEGNDYLGLFGYAGYYPNSATIKDLGVEAVFINSANGHTSVGALVGEMYNGQIDRCYTTGSINLGDGCDKIGGLIGYSTSGDIYNSYSRCSITCGINSSRMGGLAGGCYGVEFEYNYAAGPVNAGSGSSEVGGFLGVNDNNSVFRSNFWDMDTSGQNVGVIAEGLRMVEMFSQRPFIDAEWDFIGETINGENDYWKSPTKSYPMLSWQAYTVSEADLMKLADVWLTDSVDPNVIYPVDYWQDSTINMLDFAMLSQSWLSDRMTIQFAEIFDGFETADFSAMNWSGEGSVRWQVTGTDSYEGAYCAAVQQVPGGQASQLSLEVVSGAGKLGFYYKMSGSRNIYVYIEDEMVGILGSVSNWTYTEYDITEGLHTCRWLFYRLLGGSTEDIAKLDNITIYSPD